MTLLLKKVNKTTDRHLLVVDDLSHMRYMLQGMLKKNGYKNLTVVESGKSVLKEMALHPADLVITDWLMPNMDGIELLKKIKSDPKLFLTAVLMITGVDETDKIRYATEEGVDSLLVKPVSENALIQNVIQTLEKKDAPKTEFDNQVIEMRRMKLAKRYRQALDLGYKIQKIRNSRQVTLMMCECLYRLQEYEKAMSMMEETGEANRTSEHLNLLGKIHLGLGQHSQGILALESAVKMNPLNSDMKVDLVAGYYTAGKSEEAEQAAKGIITSNPTDLNLVNIAQVYLDQNQMDKAAHLLDQTVDPIPETVRVFNNYAVALRKLDRLEDAANIYYKCLKVNPNWDVLHYNLAVLHMKNKNMKEAFAALTKALKLNPNNELANDLLAQYKAN